VGRFGIVGEFMWLTSVVYNRCLWHVQTSRDFTKSVLESNGGLIVEFILDFWDSSIKLRGVDCESDFKESDIEWRSFDCEIGSLLSISGVGIAWRDFGSRYCMEIC
jgi:hypothetical protein